MPLGNPIRKQNESRMVSVLATEGQTVFTVQGGYIINHISVFRNGVRLSPAEDFTAGDGSTVTLNNAANIDDRIDFHIFDRFTVQNAIIGAASTQTINGDLVLNGKLFGQLDVPSINLTGIITATELDLNGKGDVSSDLTIGRHLSVAGVTTHSNDVVFAGASASITFDKSNDDLEFQDNAKAIFGTNGDLSIYHDGTSCNIRSTSTKLEIRSPELILQNSAAEKYFRGLSDGAAEIYFDNSLKLATTSGGVNVTGVLTATSFVGNVTGASSQITVADESSDTTCFPTFVTAATGNLPPKTGTNLTFNSSTGALTATSFVGSLTGTASGNAVLTGSTNNQLVTVTGANAITGETNLTWDGTILVADKGSSNGSVIQARNDDDTAYSSLAEGHLNSVLSLQSTTPGGQNDQSVGIQFSLGLSGQTGVINEIGAVRTGSGQGDFVFRTRNSSTGRVERLRIKHDGKVGIGTDNPINALEVYGSSADIVVYDTDAYSANSTGGVVAFQGNDSAGNRKSFADIRSSTSGSNVGELKIRTRQSGGTLTEAIKIDANGHTRFGPSGDGSDPSWSDASYGNTEVAIDGGGGYGVLHFRGDGAGSVATRFSMGVGDDKFYMAYDDVDGQHRMVVNGDGVVSIPVGIELGSGTDGTPAGNILDDYEEGVFTPTISQGATISSYAIQVGHYTKIGNQVLAYIYLLATASSSTGSSLIVGGLPFANNSTSYNEGGGYITYMNGTFGTGGVELHAMPWVPTSQSYVIFHTPEDGNNVLGNQTNFANKYLIFQIRYHV